MSWYAPDVRSQPGERGGDSGEGGGGVGGCGGDAGGGVMYGGSGDGDGGGRGVYQYCCSSTTGVTSEVARRLHFGAFTGSYSPPVRNELSLRHQ